MNGSTIALVGLGDLGGLILELLVQLKAGRKIIVFDKNETRVKNKIFSIVGSASYLGIFPDISFQKLDLQDMDKSAEAFKKFKPDVIINCTTLMSWWERSSLPAKIRKDIQDAGVGPWLPLHLTLSRKLMMAIDKANITTHVVNTCYPDAVNAILAKVGLSPTIGGGNSDLLVPCLQKIAGEKMGVPSQNIAVYMIAHHFHVASLFHHGNMGGVPYFLKIMVGDQDISNELNLEKMLHETVRLLPSGREMHPLVAASFVKNTIAILNDTGEITHAPGPEGLLGGWPVRLSKSGAQMLLPQGIDMSSAIHIVKTAQEGDGIENIKNDGTVVITQKAYSIMKKAFGYDCQAFSLEESEERANELILLINKNRE